MSLRWTASIGILMESLLELLIIVKDAEAYKVASSFLSSILDKLLKVELVG